MPKLKSICTVLFLSLIILFVCHKQILADQLGVPVVHNGQKYKYVEKIKKTEKVITNIEMIGYLYAEDGKKYYKLMINEFPVDGRHFEKTSIYEADDLLKLVSLKTIRTTKDGKVYEEINKTYNDESLSYPGDLYLADSHLPCVLKGFPFRKQKKSFIHLDVNYKDVIKMNLKIDGRETITVPAGSFKCIRLRMRADVKSVVSKSQLPLIKAVSRFISLFVPTHYFWFTDDESHLFVKLEGVEGGGVFARDIVMELVSIEEKQVTQNQE